MLGLAMQLIEDALNQPAVLEIPTVDGPDDADPPPPELIERAYRESPPTMRRFLSYLTDNANRRVPNDEVAQSIGLTRPQLAGMLGAFGRRWANRYFNADWMVDEANGQWKWQYRMPEEAADIIRGAQSGEEQDAPIT